MSAPVVVRGMSDTPRVIRDLPEVEYHGDRHTLSSSGAKTCAVSPAAYDAQWTSPAEPTDSMRLGTATHALILGTSDVVDVGPDLRKADAKAKQKAAEAAGMPWIRTPALEAIHRMHERLRKSEASDYLFAGGEAELSVYTTHETGAPLRTRPDLIRDRKTIVDLKTAANANPKAWSKVVSDQDYHVQAAWYLRECVAADLVDPDAEFVFVVVASAYPHQVAIHRLPEEDLAFGEWTAEKGIREWLVGETTGVWRDWADPYPRETGLPEWRKRAYHDALRAEMEMTPW